MIDQWSFTAPFEGIVPHLYLDSVGLVTCGVGFMLPNLSAARTLAWSQPGDVDLDWIAVVHLEKGRTPDYYRKHTTARLSEQVMRAEFQRRISDFQKQLFRAWPTHLTYPESVRIALLDMAYTMGVSRLLKFTELRAACSARDWATAARECSRKRVQPDRNEATKALFEGLA